METEKAGFSRGLFPYISNGPFLYVFMDSVTFLNGARQNFYGKRRMWTVVKSNFIVWKSGGRLSYESSSSLKFRIYYWLIKFASRGIADSLKFLESYLDLFVRNY